MLYSLYLARAKFQSDGVGIVQVKMKILSNIYIYIYNLQSSYYQRGYINILQNIAHILQGCFIWMYHPKQYLIVKFSYKNKILLIFIFHLHYVHAILDALHLLPL